MINLIVAIANNGVIGNGNQLPWHYPEDLAYFKETTMGQTVLMGEATFRSILDYLGKPLPGRHSVVASQSGFAYPGVTVTDDVVSYLEQFPQEDDIFIIGGKTIYELTIDLAERLYITHIDRDYDGDVTLAPIDYDKYEIISERQSGELRFVVYERRG